MKLSQVWMSGLAVMFAFTLAFTTVGCDKGGSTPAPTPATGEEAPAAEGDAPAAEGEAPATETPAPAEGGSATE